MEAIIREFEKKKKECFGKEHEKSRGEYWRGYYHGWYKAMQFAMKILKNCSIPDVSWQSEQLPFSFIEWYSGMERQKILNAYERWKRENGNCH